MKQIMDEIYYNFIDELVAEQRGNFENSKLYQKKDAKEDTLTKTFTDEQQKAFEDFMLSYIEYQAEESRHHFMAGHKLGTQIMMETFFKL